MKTASVAAKKCRLTADYPLSVNDRVAMAAWSASLARTTTGIQRAQPYNTSVATDTATDRASSTI